MSSFRVLVCHLTRVNWIDAHIRIFKRGFYALFSVTERPFVTSGDDWMGFYWKDGKDQVSPQARDVRIVRWLTMTS